MADDIQKALLERGIIQFFDEVTTASAKDVCEKIIELNARSLETEKGKAPTEIRLLINSNGGELPAGFSIIDVMEWSSLPIRTIGIGQVASMGLLIFMTGTKGRRVLTPRTSILSHQAFWCEHGKDGDLLAFRKEHDLHQTRVFNHYARHTNLTTEAKIRKHLMRDRNVWLSPKEAVDFGIADKVIDNFKESL